MVNKDSQKALRGRSAITPKQIQHGWRPPSWKSIWPHISEVDVPIWTKFGSGMRNKTPITAKWSTSKPEVEFRYGGRLFFKTGSSYISAVNWDMSTTFGSLIDFDLLKAVTSTNTTDYSSLWNDSSLCSFSRWRLKQINDDAQTVSLSSLFQILITRSLKSVLTRFLFSFNEWPLVYRYRMKIRKKSIELDWR